MPLAFHLFTINLLSILLSIYNMLSFSFNIFVFMFYLYTIYRLVNNCTSKLFKDYQLQTASFVREIVLIREGTLELPNPVSLSRF